MRISVNLILVVRQLELNCQLSLEIWMKLKPGSAKTKCDFLLPAENREGLNTTS